MVNRNRVRQFATIGFYILLAALALYNPIFHLDSAVTGLPTTDFYHFHWNYWWIRHALTNGLNVYLTNYVLAPFTNNLAFHTLTPFFYPLWALLEPLLGTVAAMTGIFIFAMSASALAFYALLRREGVTVALALVGGTMLELTPLMFNGVYWTDINLMGWFWLPLLVLIWGEMVRVLAPSCFPKSKIRSSPRKRLGEKSRLFLWTLLLGVVLWAMVLTDLQYALLNAFVIVPYALFILWRTHSWRVSFNLIACAVGALALGLLLLWFVGPLPYILSFDRSDLALTPADQALSLPLLAFIWHDDPDGHRHVSVGAVLIPLILLALIASFTKIRRLISARFSMRWFWLALVPVPLILAAGAYLTIGGTQITLPYIWLHQLFGGMFRYPERFVPVFLIPGMLFAMLTLTPILAHYRRMQQTLPLILMVAVILDSHMLEPFPIQPLPTHYDFYDAMGKEPYDYVVVEVPTAGMSGEGLVGDPRDVTLQYYGITHGKRMVNAHISRIQISHFWWMRTDDAMMAWLGQRRFLEPQTVEQQMMQRIFKWPIGYFVIHRDLIGVQSSTVTEILGFFNSLPDLVCPVWVEGDAVVYRTAWHPDGCPPRIPPQTSPGDYTVDIGSNDDARYLGWGWHYSENIAGITLRWAGNYPQTQVYLDLPPGGYDLKITAQAFYQSRQLSILINGKPVGEPVTVAVQPLQPYTFHIPASAIGDGQHLDLTLAYDGTVTPAEVGMGGDQRKLAIAVDKIEFQASP